MESGIEFQIEGRLDFADVEPMLESVCLTIADVFARKLVSTTDDDGAAKTRV